MAQRVRFGIFPKLLLISLCTSLIPIGAIVYVAYTDMTGIGDLLLKEGKNGLEALGAQVIQNKAKDVASQMDVYIKARPMMSAKDLQKETEFQSLAVQPVGKTGYTAVQDSKTAVNLFHRDPKIVNMDLHQLAQKRPEFWKIMEKSLGGKESFGYYDWLEPDGKTVKKKYMYIAAVKSKTADGVEMGVAATTYLDEFSQPVILLEKTVTDLIREKLMIFYILIGITAVVVLIVSLLLAKTITRPILYLARVADEISKGKLGIKIEITSKDEIGILIDATKRMQRSLALAIKKLREKGRGPAPVPTRQ